LFTKQKNASAWLLAKKPPLNFTNKIIFWGAEICQICALFAERHSPQKASNFSSDKV